MADRVSDALSKLIASAKKRHRKLLQVQISEANQTWSEAAHGAFFEARDAVGRAQAIRRDAFYRVYDVALSAAQTAAEGIAQAAFVAGASDPEIDAYVVQNFQRSVDAFMMSCFGHGPAPAAAVTRKELLSLEGTTQSKASRIRARLVILRAEFESKRPARYDRAVAWCKHNPVTVGAMILAAIMTPALVWARSASSLWKVVTGR